MTDPRRMQYFLAVARERNFTPAAEQVHIAQPDLSRQVCLLEEELGAVPSPSARCHARRDMTLTRTGVEPAADIVRALSDDARRLLA